MCRIQLSYDRTVSYWQSAVSKLLKMLLDNEERHEILNKKIIILLIQEILLIMRNQPLIHLCLKFLIRTKKTKY